MLNEAKASNVKVICRFRPMNEKQKREGCSTIHELVDDKTVLIKDSKTGHIQPIQFTFDKVFDYTSTQSDIYSYAATSMIDDIIQGFNGTIFAYGQTSSGKTHTMQGQITQKIVQQSGIIPRMVVQIFDSIANFSENIQFRIKVSMVELYMEKLRDLINTNKNDLKIRSDKKKGIFIQNLTQTYISSPEQVYQLMEIARGTRAIAATNMNQRSSRSHLIFILTLNQNNTEDLCAKTGKLYLVDLAGSQKVNKTGAQGKVLDQAKKINISLTALGKVINALTDGKSAHVPYRDSKLTRVLQESLGGNSKTTLIVTCSPHINNMAETISTLRFGVSAKKIKNKPEINKQMTVAELQNLLQKAEKNLQLKEKYIEQLKKYILVDLKQKYVPLPQSEASTHLLNNEQEQVDIRQRQIEIQRNLNNLHQVLEEELRLLKEKIQKISIEKELLEKQIFLLKNPIIFTENIVENETHSTGAIFDSSVLESMDVSEIPTSNITIQELMKKLECVTKDKNVFDLLVSLKKNKVVESQSEEQTKLVEENNNMKMKLINSELSIEKSNKQMQKKLGYLENNLCQLTHQYYKLVVVLQRYKYENVITNKKLQQKEIAISSLRSTIKDLKDQNRQLEEQRSVDTESAHLQQDPKISIKQQKRLSKEEVTNLSPIKLAYSGSITKRSSNVVKVVRGGNK